MLIKIINLLSKNTHHNPTTYTSLTWIIYRNDMYLYFECRKIIYFDETSERHSIRDTAKHSWKFHHES